jgi:hypothetical protein
VSNYSGLLHSITSPATSRVTSSETKMASKRSTPQRAVLLFRGAFISLYFNENVNKRLGIFYDLFYVTRVLKMNVIGHK